MKHKALIVGMRELNVKIIYWYLDLEKDAILEYILFIKLQYI